MTSASVIRLSALPTAYERHNMNIRRADPTCYQISRVIARYGERCLVVAFSAYWFGWRDIRLKGRPLMPHGYRARNASHFVIVCINQGLFVGECHREICYGGVAADKNSKQRARAKYISNDGIKVRPEVAPLY